MAGQLRGGDSTIVPANTNPQVLADQVDLSQRVHALAAQIGKPAETATAPASTLTAASSDNLAAPTSKWDKFVDISEQGIKHIPDGIVHAIKNPLGLIENAAISVGTGVAAKVLLPESGPLGSICAVGLGLYFGEQTVLPIYKAYKTGMNATTMGGINQAGMQVGDALGGLAVNAPIGYAGYKLGARLGDGIMASPKMAGYVQWKADTLNPINDSITSGYRSAKAGIASGFESSKEGIASVYNNTLDRLRGVERAEVVESDAPLQYPKLPDRYAPIKEKFSGTQVTGISREFLKNLDVDNDGNYYGAGLRYPDVMADPQMKAYIEAQNKLTMSRIDPAIYQQELASEAKTGGAFGKLPDGWDNGTAKSLNAIDVTDGGDGSMTVGNKTYTLTDEGAPYRKLTVSDGSGTRTLIPESKGIEIQQVIHASAGGADKLAVVGSQDGASVLHVYDGNGKLQSQVPLPGYGTLHDVRAGASGSQLQFLYDTPIAPPQALTLDMASNKAAFSQLPGYSFPSGDFVTEKLMVPYKDINGNTQTAPAFLSYAKNMVKNGQNPSALSIYGGFDVGPQYLKYMANSASLLENGFVTVDPVLPGDGGLGSGNYQAGLLQGIDNNVLALSAIIEKLHELGYSSPDLTGIYGRSNGGMVVGTFLNNRPELVGAAVPESGVHSLFDSAVINPDTGKYWDPEFGDPHKPGQVPWMNKLDVLTNIDKAKRYPATLVMQGTKDGVVNVGNSITYANIRQGMNNGETLLFSRIGEGHDPTSLALQTAFLRDRLSVSKPA